MSALLLTGASGSFGRAFIRTLLTDPSWSGRIIAMARNSEQRYHLEQLIERDERVVVVPGDVRQPEDLEAVFSVEPVGIVVHAAAEKHIGTGQRFAAYTWSVNYGGALNVIDAARRHGVSRVLALSTDKACEPVPDQAYGQSKAKAEHAFVSANDTPGPRFSLVRYGNCLGSSGSVVPLFLEQGRSGTVTITDARMSRFWMPVADPPIAEIEAYEEQNKPVMSAVRLVRLSLAIMTGGEIFVPRIISGTVQDLAGALAPTSTMKIIGIRSGEKLHERLIGTEEGKRTWWLAEHGLFVIAPTVDWRPPWPAERAPSGFWYGSEQGIRPVTCEERVRA